MALHFLQMHLKTRLTLSCLLTSFLDVRSLFLLPFFSVIVFFFLHIFVSFFCLFFFSSVCYKCCIDNEVGLYEQLSNGDGCGGGANGVAVLKPVFIAE